MKALRKNATKIFAVITAAIMCMSATGFAASNIFDQIGKYSSPIMRSAAARSINTSGYTEVRITNAQELVDNLGKGDATPDTANKLYILDIAGNELDMSGVTNFLPVPEFKGVFRGSSKIIKNLHINVTTENSDAAFVQTLAQGASIEHVTFSDCSVLGKQNKAGMVAATSYGEIDNVYVTNAKIGLNTNQTSAIMGGLVGEFHKTQTGAAEGTPTGKITNCTFSGKIQVNGADISGTQPRNVGGLIGNNAERSITSADITSIYWDMATTPGVTNPTGGSGQKPAGAIGFKMEETKTMLNSIEPNFQSTLQYDALITYMPEGAKPTARWSIESQTPVSQEAGAEVLQVTSDGGGIKAVGVGTAVVSHTIDVGSNSVSGGVGASLTVKCTVKVVEDKEGLKALVEEARKTYDSAHAGDYATPIPPETRTPYQVFEEALNAANTVANNDSALRNEIQDAITALQTQIDNLTQIDIERLRSVLASYSTTKSEGAYYESTTFATFSTAYTNGEGYANKSDTTTTQVRNAITALDNSYNSLKLLLKDVTAERDADNTAVIINVGGYQKPGETIPSGAGAIVSAQTNLPIEATNVDGSGKMTIRINKAAIGSNFNLGTTFKVIVTSNNKESAEQTVVLGKRDNYITGDVQSGDLGTISWGERFEDTSIKGIPVTYDPKTGDENGAKVDGKVVSWELDDDPQYDENGEPQSWNTVGVKHLKGMIAEGDYKQPEDTNHYAYATIEIIDKRELNNRLTEVSGYAEKNYTAATWPAFKLARDEANRVNKEKSVTQADIDKALKDLNDAITALKSQPAIVLKSQSTNLRIGDVFEPLSYVRSITDISDGDAISSKIIVTTGEGENKTVIYENGAIVKALDTSKQSTHKVIYSVTNSQDVSAEAELTVNVFGSGSSDDTNNTGGTGGTGGNGNNSNGNVIDGNNTVTDGTVIIDFNGKDIFTDEEIKAGAKLIIETKIVTDETNIRAVLEKLAKVLKGEVTIDGIYDIVLYKEIEGNRTKIANSDIKNFLTVYLPISQQAIDSKDYAVIHVLDNGGYDLLKGGIKEVDGKQYVGVKSKSFSEYAVVYGGGIGDIADTMDTSDTNNTNNNNNNSNNTNNNGGTNNNGNNTANGTDDSNATNQGGGDGADATNQGGGEDGVDDTSTGGIIQTGDTAIILAIGATVVISMMACVMILLKKRRYNK